MAVNTAEPVEVALDTAQISRIEALTKSHPLQEVRVLRVINVQCSTVHQAVLTK